jgi:type IV pilus assembly protein PilO
MAIGPQSQKDQIKLLIAIVALALGGAYYAYPYLDKEKKLEAVTAHIEQLDRMNTKARSELARSRQDNLKADAQRYTSELEAMRRLVPTANEVPALLEQVSNAARRANLDVGAVSPEPMTPGDQFDTYRYKFTVLGSYHAIGEFMANIGSLPRIAAPVTFNLVVATPRSGAGAPSKAELARRRTAALQTTFTLQTYVAHTTPVAPSAKGGA